jgi:hypothetical protein
MSRPHLEDRRSRDAGNPRRGFSKHPGPHVETQYRKYIIFEIEIIREGFFDNAKTWYK